MNDINEQTDDLLIGNLKILQKKGSFRYGTDAVVLSNFAAKYIKKGSNVLDIGTGTGILPLLLSAKTEAEHFTGLEIQKDMADLAKRSVRMNEESGALSPWRIEIQCGDIRNAKELLPSRSFDAIVTNPPYKRAGAGMMNGSPSLDIARHEIMCTLSDIAGSAAYLLKSYGDFIMVNRPERLADAIETLRANRLEPKEIQFVYSDIKGKPVLFLLRAVLFGGSNLVIEQGIEVK